MCAAVLKWAVEMNGDLMHGERFLVCYRLHMPCSYTFFGTLYKAVRHASFNDLESCTPSVANPSGTARPAGSVSKKKKEVVPFPLAGVLI